MAYWAQMQRALLVLRQDVATLHTAEIGQVAIRLMYEIPVAARAGF
jgi:hypothetical protein